MISWGSLHRVSWNPWISSKSLEILDFHWFLWLWWWLAISIVRNDLPKPDRTWTFVSNFLKRLGKVHFRGGINCSIVWSRDLVMIATSRILKSMDFIKILRNPWFALILVTLVMTSDLGSKERPTKTRQYMKICFKLSQTLGESPFPGWNQLSNSLKSWSRDDRYIECLEIHDFHQNP